MRSHEGPRRIILCEVLVGGCDLCSSAKATVTRGWLLVKQDAMQHANPYFQPKRNPGYIRGKSL